MTAESQDLQFICGFRNAPITKSDHHCGETMDQQYAIKHLNELLQLEYDAAHAYITCIKHVDGEDIQDHLTEFLADHNRHVNWILECVRKLGGEPKARPDMKGPLIKGMTSIMSRLGDKNALRVMHQNENLTNSTYDSQVKLEYSPDIQAKLKEFQSDERRHRAWIEQKLAELQEGRLQPSDEERPGTQP
jgi:rubrerythrin